jgi:hypothetical protein
MQPRCSDTKPLCHVAHASVALPGVSIAHISGNKPLFVCQDERPRASLALMRHAWRDRAYPGACEAVFASVVRVPLLSERQAEPRHASPTAGRETTPCRHQRCPGLALRAADTLLTPTRGAPPRARIATASACMLPTPSRILHGHGGKRRRRVAYLLTADNDHRPLLTRLSDVNQPVIRSRNPLSRPHPARLASI